MVAAHLQFSVDLDRLTRVFLALTLVGLAILALAIVGEWLHWWNDLGLGLAVLGIVVSVVMGAVTGLLAATKGQVRVIAEAVVDTNRKQDAMLGKQDETNRKLDGLADLLRQIRDRLPG